MTPTLTADPRKPKVGTDPDLEPLQEPGDARFVEWDDDDDWDEIDDAVDDQRRER